MVALLTGETLEVVDVRLRSHHHLERRDHLGAGGAVSGRAEQSTAKRTSPVSEEWHLAPKCL